MASTWPRTKETACLVFLSLLTRESAYTPISRCRGEYHLRCCGPVRAALYLVRKREWNRATAAHFHPGYGASA